MERDKKYQRARAIVKVSVELLASVGMGLIGAACVGYVMAALGPKRKVIKFICVNLGVDVMMFAAMAKGLPEMDKFIDYIFDTIEGLKKGIDIVKEINNIIPEGETEN